MNKKLNALKKVNAKNCVSIILNTHRTAPDNQKDVITLKNLIKEVEERLMNSLDKKEAQSIVESLMIPLQHGTYCVRFTLRQAIMFWF